MFLFLRVCVTRRCRLLDRVTRPPVSRDRSGENRSQLSRDLWPTTAILFTVTRQVLHNIIMSRT